jgi:hypothetical protein
MDICRSPTSGVVDGDGYMLRFDSFSAVDVSKANVLVLFEPFTRHHAS